jgi:RimJ/RimL family protein N-acetyltransferase
LLWQWANDPQVRLQSLHPEPIALETHLHWYAAKLLSPLTRIWVVCLADEPVGQIRYDVIAPTVAEIDYSVSLAHRGKGIGSAMVRETYAPACASLLLTEVRAVVRTSNPASARAFEKAGFQRIGAIVQNGYDCIVYAR